MFELDKTIEVTTTKLYKWTAWAFFFIGIVLSLLGQTLLSISVDLGACFFLLVYANARIDEISDQLHQEISLEIHEFTFGPKKDEAKAGAKETETKKEEPAGGE